MSIHGNKVFRALTKYQLAADIEDWGWEIGDYTYGRPLVLEPQLAKLKIGRFCSIGPDVTFILGNHRTDTVTTYPFAELKDFWDAPEDLETDHSSKGDIVVGNDVWFGAGSTILSGAVIGTGAVIGAGAMIRGDIPPYAIVAGNPCRVIRKRFSDDLITRLLATSWWDWDRDRIRDSLSLLMSGDIEAFLRKAESFSATDHARKSPAS
ncbi:CatB-related O-acetyltransferase [Acetobacter sp. AN02]|uniref:CatB-related O-acetyltransferase n=1 Tax=Acetobacter sp. AN02 TaxID=2894186 RepID=UPI0024346408|nr:CatB-related O-acetyltransferase [Acetobacter sp. AN02]MDG6093596.1 CatB-related O-acetyltransferase [Acetobacter sp. AN02]